MSRSKKEYDSWEPPPSKKWVACPLEDEYFKDSRKIQRMERKRRTAQDRSKYKKTDLHKFSSGVKTEIKERGGEKSVVHGRVLSMTSRGAVVEHEGIRYTCFLRGLLKKQKTLQKNLVTVGDFVLFEILADKEGYILEIEPRKSVLSRADNLSRNKEHFIAANIDQVLITMSVVSPMLKSHLIDRYIIAARKGGMEPVIIINKIDLLEEGCCDEEIRIQQQQQLELCEQAYQKAGIPLVKMSAENDCGIEELKQLMKDKSSVFSGQSGTGKSSLINAVAGLHLPVGETVHKTRKGSHTTTNAQLVPLEFGGWCIDTPGIKSFGVWDLSEEELVSYFTEIHELGKECKFPNCSHTHEVDCAVLKALENGKISSIRYQSYEALMATIQEEQRRR